MSKRTTGEIRKVYHDEDDAKYEWTVPNFFPFFCPRQLLNDDSCFRMQRAPPIRCFGVTWRFQAESCLGVLWLGLSIDGEPEEPCDFSVGIKCEDGKGEVTLFSEQTLHDSYYGNTRWRSTNIEDWLNWQKLGLNPLRSKGAVTFIFTLDKGNWCSYRRPLEKRLTSRETQTEVSDAEVKGECGEEFEVTVDPSLQKHLKNLLLSGEDHDITINVRNRKFRAHRDMLRARSPVFEAMFKHDMGRSGHSISIDDCDPDTFGEFLQYVYTGKVENLSPGKAMGLYYAGDKYDFSDLKVVCVQFLEASLSKTSICDVISLATTHGESGLLQKTIRFFSENTEEILQTVEWQRFAEKDSLAATELYLKAFGALKRQK